MSDRIKKIKIKQSDGTFSDYIPIGADAKNIDFEHNGSNIEKTLKKKPYYFKNVEEMKNCEELQIGDMAITLGYYEANDGGGAEYEIKIQIDNSLNENISLNNELIAQPIIHKYNNYFEISKKTYKNLTKEWIVRNGYFKGTGSISDDAVLVLSGENNCDVVFENCIFDNFNFQLYTKGKHEFINCTFKNSITSNIHISSDNVILSITNCNFINTRPNLTEWNENVSSARFWKFNPINIYGNNNKVYIKNSKFINIMAQHYIFSPRTSSNHYVEVSCNYFKDCEANGICFEDNIDGIISNNTFLNTGSLRGTEDYQTSETNKGAGCNAIFCPNARHLSVLNNRIINCVENGIEGRYEIISNNYIENTGYRYEEGYQTPSTEGIWGYANTISNNTIVNPHTHGILISTVNTQELENIVIENNNCSSKIHKNNTYGIQLTIDSTVKNVSIINNILNGFYQKYNIINTNAIPINNVHIHDQITKNQRESLIYDVFNHLSGLEFTSNIMEKIDWNNIYFKFTTNDIIDDWGKSNCIFTQEVDEKNEKYGKIVTNDIYGRIFNSKIQLPTDYYSILCLHLRIKSLSKTSINVHCTDDNGTTYPAENGSVYSGYKINIPPCEDYEDYYVTIKAIGLTDLSLWGTEAQQEIDIKCFEGWKVN